eukprot:CAMPEP_0182417272 /NCGR_PEP_ID=MMETSP1167-20130531/1701_1 /TAXON_ID=2988 /ORGANISM="Mallomonas Sp, Strain CCMP3275" /LENGTH=314 /DNA_ID=CAMNT_0024590697 /DNA_START=1352 /DNA_END=2296 /DNA_ORIENTATION=-
MIELCAHSRPVYSVSQSGERERERERGGRLVLSSSADESIRLWDVRLALSLSRYSCDRLGLAWQVKFCPLDYYFLSGHRKGVGAIWSTDRPSPLRLLTGHRSDVTCVAWHPASTLALTGSDDRSVRLWDMRCGSAVRVMPTPSPPGCLALSRDGFSVAAGTQEGSVCLWDLTAGRHAASLVGHSSEVHALSFSERDRALASGGADSTVRLWDLQRLSLSPSSSLSISPSSSLSPLLLKPHHTLHTKHTPVYCLKYGPGNLLYAGGPFAPASSLYEGEGGGKSERVKSEKDKSVLEPEDRSISLSLGIAHIASVG